VLSSLARGASEADRSERLAPAGLIHAILGLARQPAAPGGGDRRDSRGAPPDVTAQRQCACLDALAALAYDDHNRRRFLHSPDLMELLSQLAFTRPAPGAPAPVVPAAPAAGTEPATAPEPTASSGAAESPAKAASAVAAASGGDGAALPRDASPGSCGGGSGGGQGNSSNSSGSGPPTDSVTAVAAEVTGSSGSGSLRAELAAPMKGGRPGGAGAGAGRGGGGRAAVLGPALCDPRLYAIRLLAVLGG
jgi:hypothetical protein